MVPQIQDRGTLSGHVLTKCVIEPLLEWCSWFWREALRLLSCSITSWGCCLGREKEQWPWNQKTTLSSPHSGLTGHLPYLRLTFVTFRGRSVTPFLHSTVVGHCRSLGMWKHLGDVSPCHCHCLMRKTWLHWHRSSSGPPEFLGLCFTALSSYLLFLLWIICISSRQ